MSGQELQMLLTTVGFVLPLLRNEARYAEQDERLDEEQRKQALKSINLALKESRKYLAVPRENHNKQEQLEVSKLWNDASIEFRKVSGEMVSITAEKANYWADDLKWPEKIVIEKGIDLNSIQIEFDRLIHESSGTS